MAVQQAARTGAGVTARAVAWQSNLKAMSMAEKLDQQRLEREAREEAAQLLSDTASAASRPAQATKSFSFHLGADMHIPTADRRKTHTAETPAELADRSNPFSGLPLQAWAERMGERIMPAYDLIQEERKKAKLAAQNSEPQPFVPPTVPHFLPFTKWAAASKQFQETLIAEDPKDRKKARLSWYHPDDTMVPRNWFKGGLLEDLKYYSPFRTAAPATAAQ